MTTKQAIDILKRQRAKLDKPNDETWVLQTASYIKDIFGDKSVEFEAFTGFKLTRRVISIWQTQPDNDEVERVVNVAKKFLDDCIETLRHKGIYKPPTTNFLQRLDNATIWTIIAFAIPSLIATGFFFGNLKYDKDKLELEQHIKQLQDSLFIIKSSIPIIISTDSATNQKSTDNKAEDTIPKH